MKKDIETEFVNLEKLISELDLTQKVKRSLNKQISAIRKCIKPKRSGKARSTNQNSGLQKPLGVSSEMVDFANDFLSTQDGQAAKWDYADLHSRVDITKIICSYIEANSLQKPEDRRVVILDDRLKRLLGCDSSDIKYPHIQKYIGQHLIKPEKEECEATEKPKAEKTEKKAKKPAKKSK